MNMNERTEAVLQELTRLANGSQCHAFSAAEIGEALGLSAYQTNKCLHVLEEQGRVVLLRANICGTRKYRNAWCLNRGVNDEKQ